MIHFVTDPNTREQEGEISNNFHFFLENELKLVNSCSFIPNDDFEDFQAQATYSGAYLLWLIKVKLNHAESTSSFTFINPGFSPKPNRIWLILPFFDSSELSKAKYDPTGREA